MCGFLSVHEPCWKILLLTFSGQKYGFAFVTLVLEAADFSTTLTKTYEISMFHNLYPTRKQNMHIIFP
jgi:hypothetical protein